MATMFNRVDEMTTGRVAANDENGEYRPSADEPFMSLRQQAPTARRGCRPSRPSWTRVWPKPGC